MRINRDLYFLEMIIDATLRIIKIYEKQLWALINLKYFFLLFANQRGVILLIIQCVPLLRYTPLYIFCLVPNWFHPHTVKLIVLYRQPTVIKNIR